MFRTVPRSIVVCTCAVIISFSDGAIRTAPSPSSALPSLSSLPLDVEFQEQEYGWASEQDIDCSQCECGPEVTGVNGNSYEDQDFATVSYYIAQGLGGFNTTIRAPVPCLSRITVTNIATGAQNTARITHVCTYCQVKHIGLSSSAFARIRQSEGNESRLEVSWRIDILRSAEDGNNAPNITDTSNNEAAIRREIVMEYLENSFIKNSLRLGANCDLQKEEERSNIFFGNVTHLFKTPTEFTALLELRYKFEHMNQLGPLCDMNQDLTCHKKGRCRCIPAHRPQLEDLSCLEDGHDHTCIVQSGLLSEIYGLGFPPRTDECPVAPSVCSLALKGDLRCSARYLELQAILKNESGEERRPLEVFAAGIMWRIPGVGRNLTDSRDCMCMSTYTFSLFVDVLQASAAMLERLPVVSILEMGDKCESRAEERKKTSWLKLGALDRQLNPEFISGRIFDGGLIEYKSRVKLVDGLEALLLSLPDATAFANDTFCKIHKRLGCNRSGVCDCYTNLSQNVEFLREGDTCVLNRDSICDPAYWDGRFENYVDEYEEDATRPVCEGGLPCVDMRTGRLCPRNDSFATVSFKYKLFPFLHEQFNEQDPGAFNLTLEDYCRCHETFDPDSGDDARKIWLPTLAATLAVLVLLLLASIGRFQLRQRKWNLERQRFLEGDPDHDYEGHELESWLIDGAARAQALPYDERYEIDPDNLAYEPLAVRAGRLHRVDLGNEQYELLKLNRLGYGGFGVAVRGVLRKESEEKEVVVKTCEQAGNRVAISSIWVEIKILSYVGQHPNVVEYIGAIAKNVEIPKLVLELCEHGSLQDFLLRNKIGFGGNQIMGDTFKPALGASNGFRRNWKISTTNLLCWSYQVANGMEFLGTKDVVHGDLFLKNVLLTSVAIAKVTDFGLSRRFAYRDSKKYVKAYKALGPLSQLLPPEARTEPRKLSPAVDAWTFGVMLWQMLSFDAEPEKKCVHSSEELPKPENATTAMDAISRRCWVADLSQRIGFGELKVLIRELLGDGLDPTSNFDLDDCAQVNIP